MFLTITVCGNHYAADTAILILILPALGLSQPCPNRSSTGLGRGEGWKVDKLSPGSQAAEGAWSRSGLQEAVRRLDERVMCGRLAKLKNEVVILGVNDHFEVRDRSSWHAYVQQMLSEQPQLMMNPRRAVRRSS